MNPIPVSTPAKVSAMPLQPQSFSRREWIFRLVILTVLCGAIGLAWWTFKVRLLPLQQQSRELTASVSRLSTEVDQLERQWPQPKQEEVARRLAQAHTQLFGNQAALEAWLSQLKAQAEPLCLDTKAVLGQSIPKLTGEEELAVIPTTVSVNVRTALNDPAKESAYQRLLRLTQRLSIPQKRSDLAALTVIGGTNSVSNAQLVFHLWAGQGGKL
jgi:hypothetical protein